MNCSYCGTPQIVPDEVPRLRALVDSTERHALKLEAEVDRLREASDRAIDAAMAEVDRLRRDLRASKAMHEDARLLSCELHAEVERLRGALTTIDALCESAMEDEQTAEGVLLAVYTTTSAALTGVAFTGEQS